MFAIAHGRRILCHNLTHNLGIEAEMAVMEKMPCDATIQ